MGIGYLYLFFSVFKNCPLVSYNGTTYEKGYLNNGLWWYTMTPTSNNTLFCVYHNGTIGNDKINHNVGVRPSINLKGNVKIASGSGTIDSPYRLDGDNDDVTTGTLLSTRYSGEYVKFGVGENNLYRIVSHEDGVTTKITSALPLKDNGVFKQINLDSKYSIDTKIGSFLNNEYLSNYINSDNLNMIVADTVWYLGTVKYDNYKFAKYDNPTTNTLTADTTVASVGLLRVGELMANQFDRYDNNIKYYVLNFNVTPTSNSMVDISDSTMMAGIKPAMNLKSNLVITGGDGTKSNPFTIKLNN